MGLRPPTRLCCILAFSQRPQSIKERNSRLLSSTAQRIARRGNYGAFLIENLPIVKSVVEKLASNLNVRVSCKIRVFLKLEDTIKYARMLEEAGCSLLAVHGLTRDEKDQKKVQADWNAIKVVKSCIRIPLLANGNIWHMRDVHNCLKETGVDGVLSADSLLENRVLYAGYRTSDWASVGEESSEEANLDQADLFVEYLNLCERYPVPWRMIHAYVDKMLGDWFRIQPHVREDLNVQSKMTFEYLYNMVDPLGGPQCENSALPEGFTSNGCSSEWFSYVKHGSQTN